MTEMINHSTSDGMSLSPLGTEDQRKLHAEVNQIINQRFLLTTTAITVFGAFSAFMIPRAVSASITERIGPILYVASIFLLFFFLLLFVWNRVLLTAQFILVTYLKARKASEWEEDIDAYHLLNENKKSMFSRVRFYGLLYAVLGTLAFLWPFAVASALSVNSTVYWPVAHATAFCAYLVALALLSRESKNKTKVHLIWLKVLKQRHVRANRAEHS